MKQLISLMVLVFCYSALTISCKEHKHDHNTDTSVEEHHAAEKADLAMNDVFQCPMDCEDGKTYEEAGSCPVCKMDLKEVEKSHEENHDHDDHSDHEH